MLTTNLRQTFKSSSILSSNHNSSPLNNFHQFNNLKSMKIDEVSFKGVKYSHKQLLDEERDNHSWWSWHVAGGKEEAEIKVKGIIDGILKGQDDIQKEQKEKDALQERLLEAERSKIQIMQDNAKVLEDLLKTAQANKDNESSKPSYNDSEVQRLREELKDLKEALRKRTDDMSEAEKIWNDLNGHRKNHGFAKIAGYQKEKDILKDNFIQTIAMEKAGKDIAVPSGVLFFGPMGNGKTTFATAFAQQAKCHPVEIPIAGTPEAVMERITKAAEEAKQRFENGSRQRTIIILNEFNKIAKPDSPINEDLKDFMDRCSEKYHCTLFLTTNHPLQIDPIILQDVRVPVKVFLEPPNKENAKDVVSHYLPESIRPAIDHDEIANTIISSSTDEAFSNSRIKTVVEKCYKDNKGDFTTEHLVNAFKTSARDIKKDALEKFEQEIREIIGEIHR